MIAGDSNVPFNNTITITVEENMYVKGHIFLHSNKSSNKSWTRLNESIIEEDTFIEVDIRDDNIFDWE